MSVMQGQCYGDYIYLTDMANASNKQHILLRDMRNMCQLLVHHGQESNCNHVYQCTASKPINHTSISEHSCIIELQLPPFIN